MKAIQVSYSSLTGKSRAKAEGVPAITRSQETLDNSFPALDIATQLCDKYNWLQDGKFRLEEGGLPNGDTVFVFVKNEVESKPDIRRDLRLLLAKYNAQLVAVDYNDPSACLNIKLEAAGGYPTLFHFEQDNQDFDSTHWSLSEEAINDPN